MNKIENLENWVNFFISESNKLKTTTRYSSCLENIQESTAAHSWHLTLMFPIVAEKLDLNINVSRAMKIALVHDLPEYPLEKDYESYLIFNGNLSKDKKDKSEEDTMFKLAQNSPFWNSLYFLWKEYQEGKTNEAKYVKAMDKCESILHVMARGGIINKKGIEFQAHYADDAVRNFPQLKPFLRDIKKKMRYLVELRGFEWKPEYNYPD